MKLLFIHQNFPGQYKHLAPAMAARGHEVLAITDAGNLGRARCLCGEFQIVAYPSPRGASPSTHGYLQSAEEQVRRGQAVARALLEIRTKGFEPDVVVGHPAWGECLFVKDVFPSARLIVYAEFFYRAERSDFAFDPEYPSTFDHRCRLRLRNTTQLVSLECADAAISPTAWQRSQYPEELRARISIVHDGIDTEVVQRRPSARFALPSGEALTAADEVVTYVARNLEPYRGFHSFMRALPFMQRERPKARFVVVGGDGVSYGRKASGGVSYRELLTAELGAAIDPDRVFFVGRTPYDAYLNLLSISSAHVYLTYPFVLSWSMLEAMACSCPVVASRTAPVEEVIEDGRNGLLVDFFSPQSIAERVGGILEDRHRAAALADAARRRIVERYDLGRCLPLQIGMIERQAARGAGLCRSLPAT